MQHLNKSLIGCLILGFIINACKQNENKGDIVGVWKGTKTMDCPPALGEPLTPDQVEFEFTSDGKYIRKIYSSNSNPDVYTGTYELKEDTLIWSPEKTDIAFQRQHLDFLSSTNLSWTLALDTCTAKTALEKMSK